MISGEQNSDKDVANAVFSKHLTKGGFLAVLSVR